MKKLLVFSITLGLLLAPVTAVQAQSMVEISLGFAPDTVYVQAGDYIVLRTGWGACTRGLVRKYQNAAHYELMLDDVPLITPGEDDQYFTPIEPLPNPGWNCITAPHGRNTSVTDWRYPLGTLGSGTYEIYFHQWVDRKVTDGADGDYDGRLDVYEGTIRERIITLIVN